MSETLNDHQRAVHALEEHGYLFERACLAEAQRVSGFRFESEEYPVSINGQDSVVDFILSIEKTGYLTYLIFECKRANPDYVTWLFATAGEAPGKKFLATRIDRSQHYVNVVWLQTAELPLGERFAAEALEVSDRQRSTRGKSSKSGVIYSACQQALTGVGGLALEHRKWMGEDQNKIRRQQYLPIVLTTANLLLMEYQTSGIDLSTGCLDSQTAKTTGIEWAILDVPVRDGLRVTTPDHSSYGGCGPSEDFRRRFKVKSVAIVKGTSIRPFLEHLRSNL